METVLEGRRPPTNVGGKWRKQGKGPHTDVEVRAAYGLYHLAANVEYLSRVELTTFALFKRDDGWLVMLKGQGPRRPMIAWLHAPTFKAALVLATTSVDSAHVEWRVEVQKKDA